MRECGILFAILGILVCLMGIYVYSGHNDFFPKLYSVPDDKNYLKYLGKIIIIVGLVIAFIGAIMIFI